MKLSQLTGSYCLIIIFTGLSLCGMAQSLTGDDIKAQMVQDWQRAKDYTVEYLNAMPADKYGARAVDSVPRSFAQQMLHLAQGNIFIMSSATDAPTPDFFKSDLEHSTTAQSPDSVMYYVKASYDYCVDAINKTPADKLGEKKKVFGMEATRYALMEKAFEHQGHHRGQTTIYIRLQGIRPPQEKLF